MEGGCGPRLPRTSAARRRRRPGRRRPGRRRPWEGSSPRGGRGRFLGVVATRGRVDQVASSLCRRSAGVSQPSV
ncbi:hypothetical protein FRZ00_23810, partial [Streptomyces mobaraensis]